MICEVDLRKAAVRLYWRKPDGSPYGYLQSLPRSLGGKTEELLFATNAGMFDPAIGRLGSMWNRVTNWCAPTRNRASAIST